VAGAAVEVGADDRVPVVGEAAGELPVELVPPRHVVGEHHAGEGAGPFGTGDVRVDEVAVAGLVSGDAGEQAGRRVSAL